MATLHPLPRLLQADAVTPENPARVRLAEAIAALDRARGAVELATAPVHRLTEVIVEGDRLTTQLRELLDRDQTATGAWIASGRLSADPRAAADTQSLSDQVAALQPELAAAKRALPEAEQQVRAAIERLGEAAALRDMALAEVAVVAADEVAGALTEAINQALRIEAKLHSACTARCSSVPATAPIAAPPMPPSASPS